MENKPNILKRAMNYGAIVGFASIIYTVILYITDMLFNRGLSMISILILIIGIFYGTKVFRDKANEGFISYGQALTSGVLIAFFSAIITAFFSYLLYVAIDPDLIEKSFQFMEEKFIEQGKLTEDQIEMFMEKARERSNPLKNSLMSIPISTFIGFLVSLITSAILKKEQQPA